MALIECYECGKKISDTASSCPSCGAIVKVHDKSFIFSLGAKGLLLIKKELVVSIMPMMIAVIIITISYFIYASLESERLESLVRSAVQDKLNSDLSSSGIITKIPSVKITHTEGRKHSGLATVEIEGSAHEMRITIIEVDSGVEWEAMPGEALFLFPYLMKNVFTPSPGPEVKKNTSNDIPSMYRTASKIDGWSIQLASLSSSEVAISLVKRLRLGGNTAYIKTVDGINRVFVGPVVERAEADRMRDQFEEQQKMNGFVVRFSSGQD